MKPLVQKLPRKEFKSFVSLELSTPLFETPWHRHIESEILYIHKGFGTAIIGDYVGEFTSGDLFYIGSNVPHWFKKSTDDLFCTVKVIQFDPTIFGRSFISLPEMARIRQLVELKQGMRIHYSSLSSLLPRVLSLESLEGFGHINGLLNILDEISANTENELITNEPIDSFDSKGIIDEVLEYIFSHFNKNIQLEELAAIAKMSSSNFRRFFKLNTKKSFSGFIKEIRIAHACKLLKDRNVFVSQIFHECGYRNISNFNRQFKEVKGITPSQYREQIWKP